MSIGKELEFGGYRGFFSVWKKQQELVSSRSPQSIYKFANRNAKVKLGNNLYGTLALLKPVKASVPPKEAVHIVEYYNSPKTLSRKLTELFSDATYVAVDIETNGTLAHSEEDFIAGIGVASHRSIAYFDFLTNTKECNALILEWLQNPKLKLIGHNIFFDGAFLQSYTGKWLNWVCCTYGMYKQLASEGFKGQKWGLKDAQVQLLNWPDKGDVELNEWLIKNKYIKSSFRKEATSAELLAQYREGANKLNPDKSQMWRAPARILGYYCGLDCAATYQLYAEVFMPAVKGKIFEEEFLDYHTLFIKNVELLVSQQLTGITIDKEMLSTYHDSMGGLIKTAYDTFFTQEEVKPFIEEFNKSKVDSLLDKEPTKYKKMKKLGKEPVKFTKKGAVSKVWENWNTKRKESVTATPEISKNWLTWQEKKVEAERTNHFNLNSTAQLEWLFYDKLGFPALIETDTGNKSTGAKALPGFGKCGELLKTYKDLVKEEGYVKKCVETLRPDRRGSHRIYPQFRVPGTLTCRLAGSGGLNIQQIPKSRSYLSCWRPVKGRAWVDCDHSALEQVVLAELSKDDALWKIYGPTAKPNDIYLFNGSQLPGIGDAILAAGYNPDNPDKDTIGRVKKVCKKERTISKVITLGSSYGMGPKKLRLTLALQGVDISMEEAYAMYRSYWKLYSGVKDYEAFLIEEWNQNNGYVYNGFGRPVGCDKEYEKDIVNRVVQSTGHDVHMLYVRIIDMLFRENKLVVDGIVWDFHDQSIVECREEDAPLVRKLMEEDAYNILNAELGGQIPLKGEAVIIPTMAEAKCE